MPLTQYVKHVLMKDVQDLEYPVFKASEETEKEAQEELRQLDKAVDAKSFFKQLHNER
mgnify:FL=1